MSYENAIKVAHIVRDAGNQVVGRTRLQKIAYLLSATGLEGGLPFAYKHYGPYSEELASAARDAALLGLIHETEQQAQWGGVYSTYSFPGAPDMSIPGPRRQLASEGAAADAVELELVATALFLAKAGFSDPWVETARRKPEKADQHRMERAKELYRQFSQIETPEPLPPIV
jgi:uncharacterized protein